LRKKYPAKLIACSNDPGVNERQLSNISQIYLLDPYLFKDFYLVNGNGAQKITFEKLKPYSSEYIKARTAAF
jgi:hypothetical protein